MLEKAWNVVEVVSTVEGSTGFVLRFFGIRALARHLLKKRAGRTGMKIDFFPDRVSLVKAHGTLADRFKTVDSAYAIWVLGQKFFHANQQIEKLKKLLLPHPDDDGLRHYTKTSPHSTLAHTIKETARLALDRRVDVRWYRGFLCHSIVLADADRPTGWLHVESALPHSNTDHRPSYTVYRQQCPEAVDNMRAVFDKLWDSAEKVDEKTLS